MAMVKVEQGGAHAGLGPCLILALRGDLPSPDDSPELEPVSMHSSSSSW